MSSTKLSVPKSMSVSATQSDSLASSTLGGPFVSSSESKTSAFVTDLSALALAVQQLHCTNAEKERDVHVYIDNQRREFDLLKRECGHTIFGYKTRLEELQRENVELHAALHSGKIAAEQEKADSTRAQLSIHQRERYENEIVFLHEKSKSDIEFVLKKCSALNFENKQIKSALVECDKKAGQLQGQLTHSENQQKQCQQTMDSLRKELELLQKHASALQHENVMLAAENVRVKECCLAADDNVLQLQRRLEEQALQGDLNKKKIVSLSDEVILLRRSLADKAEECAHFYRQSAQRLPNNDKHKHTTQNSNQADGADLRKLLIDRTGEVSRLHSALQESRQFILQLSANNSLAVQKQELEEQIHVMKSSINRRDEQITQMHQAIRQMQWKDQRNSHNSSTHLSSSATQTHSIDQATASNPKEMEANQTDSSGTLLSHIQTLESELKAKTAECAALYSKISSLTAEVSHVDSALSTAHDEKLRLMESLQNALTDNERTRNSAECLEKKLDSIQTEYKSMRQQLEAAAEEKDAKKREMQQDHERKHAQLQFHQSANGRQMCVANESGVDGVYGALLPFLLEIEELCFESECVFEIWNALRTKRDPKVEHMLGVMVTTDTADGDTVTSVSGAASNFKERIPRLNNLAKINCQQLHQMRAWMAEHYGQKISDSCLLQ